MKRPSDIAPLAIGVVAPLLVLQGCEGGPTEPSRLEAGSFEVELSGAMDMELEGHAFSADGASADGLRVWVVDMDDGRTEVRLVVRDNRIPEPGSVIPVAPAIEGSVPPVDSAWVRLATSDDPRQIEPLVHYAHGGSVEITERSADRDRARGEFQADFRTAEGTTFTAQGRFHSIEDPARVD